MVEGFCFVLFLKPSSPLTAWTFNSHQEKLFHHDVFRVSGLEQIQPVQSFGSRQLCECNLLRNSFLHLLLEAKCSALLQLFTVPYQEHTSWRGPVPLINQKETTQLCFRQLEQGWCPSTNILDNLQFSLADQGQAMLWWFGKKEFLFACHIIWVLQGWVLHPRMCLCLPVVLLHICCHSYDNTS